MASDTLVGIFGALVIVGSMAGVIQTLDTGGAGGGPTSGEEIAGPKPQPERSSFAAEGCRAMSLYWTPPLDALDEVVGPHWTPAEGPVSGRGLFWLFAYECPTTIVDGLKRGASSGAAAIVAIEEPQDPRNVSDVGGWAAIPEWIGPKGSATTGIFREHRFNVTFGSGAVGVQSTPLGQQVRMVIDTPDGTLEASAAMTGQPQQREVEGALVGTRPSTFSVFTGPETMQRQTTGSAVVQTTGTTWVERLNLEPSPYRVAYDTQMSWDFTMWHEPWNPANMTANATVTR